MKVVLAIVMCVMAMGVNCPAQQPQVFNGVAVIVNDSIITYREIGEAVEAVIPLLKRQYENRPELLEEKIRQAKSERLQDLVEQRLILHEFETGGYNLPESFIEDELQKRIRDEFDGDRLVLTKTLQARGMTFESYRKMVRDQYIVLVMRSQNIPSKIQISPQQIEMYYLNNRDRFLLKDQVKLRMVYVMRPGSQDAREDQGYSMIQEVLDKIRAGTSFADMASLYSAGSRRFLGGDWGWIDRSVLRKELSDHAFSLEAGQVSDVITLPNGYYILKVEDKRAAHIRPLSEVREEIEVDLRAQEMERLRKKWIGKLKAKSYIRYF